MTIPARTSLAPYLTPPELVPDAPSTLAGNEWYTPHRLGQDHVLLIGRGARSWLVADASTGEAQMLDAGGWTLRLLSAGAISAVVGRRSDEEAVLAIDGDDAYVSQAYPVVMQAPDQPRARAVTVLGPSGYAVAVRVIVARSWAAWSTGPSSAPIHVGTSATVCVYPSGFVHTLD